MNRIQQALVWLSRLPHSRGFGIQSPTDYRFVRYVINEHWPYYSYQELTKGKDHLTNKLGKLYMRLANHLQPTTIIDWVGASQYLQAGCRKALITEEIKQVQLAVVPIQIDYHRLFKECHQQSVVVFQDIWKHPSLWHCIEHDEQVTVTFDLYYCGIAFFNKEQQRHNYIVNF